MKTIKLSGILLGILLSTTSYAAIGGKSTNGNDPFSTLEELITANTAEIENNTRLIEENQVDISTNADAITTLQGRADVVDASLATLEGRISQNETDIVSAEGAILANTNDINDLTISISSNINQIQRDILDLKGDIADLTGALSQLQGEMQVKILRLQNAIAENSADITVMTSVVTIMQASIGTIQSTLLGHFSRITSAEIALQNQTAELARLDSAMSLLNIRTVTLESLHPNENTREVIFSGTSAVDYTDTELRTMIKNLDLTNQDWVYFEATNFQGTSQMCTSNDAMVSAFNAFADGQYFNNGVIDNDLETTVQLLNSSSWVTPTGVYFQSSAYHAGDLVRASGWVTGIGNTQAGLQKGTDYPSHEIVTNSYSDGGSGTTYDNTLTIRAASTRLDACGY